MDVPRILSSTLFLSFSENYLIVLEKKTECSTEMKALSDVKITDQESPRGFYESIEHSPNA